jgi:RNA polymerase sigma-B factor
LREQLVRGYLPVAQHIARRFSNRGEPLDDLVQVATVGLINAIDRFSPERGHEFFSFAVPTISGEVRRHFRDLGWSMRVPRRLKDMHVSINNVVSELSQNLGRAPRPTEIADRLGVPVAEVLEGLEASEAYRSSSLDEMLSSEQGSARSGSSSARPTPSSTGSTSARRCARCWPSCPSASARSCCSGSSAT